jgi:hypothetical protein
MCAPQALADMGLLHVRGVVVGDPLNKGISGGERKRLCVALELITEPALLFLCVCLAVHARRAARVRTCARVHVCTCAHARPACVGARTARTARTRLRAAV